MSSTVKKILVALSGGVDSAVSSLVLLEQGYEIETVYVKTWEYEDDLLGDCPGARDLKDAEAVSKKIGVPFRVLNLMNFYQENVVDPMVQGYANGVTPNPDVLCNREMKFGALLDYALSEGFSSLATGHYCRRMLGPSGEIELWEGKDKNKDQSYFLCQLSQYQLSKVMFPIGDLDKKEVRLIAKQQNLITAEKKDSQGLCFVGKVKLPEFLQQKLKVKKGKEELFEKLVKNILR